MTGSSDRLQTTLIILLGMSAFVMLKIPALDLPYFWDELAGYMTCVVHMWDHGISILPSAVPAELSYGHPLLMHSVLAIGGKLFGQEPLHMHAIVLCFTLILSYGVFLLARELSKGNKNVGLLAFLMFLAQPVVFAQSTQVVLEVFLTMHVVYALYFHLRKQYFVAILFTVMAVMTKETGLVLAMAMLADTIYRFLIKDKSEDQVFKLMLYSVPLIVFGTYLLLTRQAFGWYLNPVNMGKTKLSLSSMLQKVWDYPIEFSFLDQGRWVYTASAVLIAILNRKSFKGFRINLRSPQWIIGVYILGFILFSSIADTLLRYFLNLVPFAVILFALLYEKGLVRSAFLSLLCLMIALWSSYGHIRGNDRLRDTDMSFTDMIKTNQAVLDHLNNGSYTGDTVGFVFPLNWAVTDSRFGYFRELDFIPDTSFKAMSSYKVYCSPGNLDWQQEFIKEQKKVWDTCIRTSQVFIYQTNKNL